MANIINAVTTGTTGLSTTADSSGVVQFQKDGTTNFTIDASGNMVFTRGSLQEARIAMSANDINLSSGQYFTKTISGTTTFTVSNVPTAGTVGSFILDLTNGGSSTITWWSGVKWASGSAPSLTASGRDVIGFYTHDGGTTWNGLVLGKAMA